MALIIQYTTLTAGTLTTTNQAQDIQVIHDAGTTLTLTIAFPSTPYNRQSIYIASNSGITTLTLSASTGSILNGISTMAAGGISGYMYLTAQNNWYKIK